jgi:GNAT superfamily N-acetyltransferase
MRGQLSRAGRKVGTAVRLLGTDPRRFARAVRPILFRYIVFSARAEDIAPAPARDGVEIRLVTRADLSGLEQPSVDLRDAVERCEHLLGSWAYGAFCRGELAHLSFLIPAERDGDRRPRLLRLEPGEAEIASCVTLAGFRGQGLYPYMIRHLVRLAGASGHPEVFMITERRNVASQQGILKAGFTRRAGHLYRLRFLRTDIVFRPFRRA